MNNFDNYKPLVPYMPLDPKVTNAYVPYQLDVEEVDTYEGWMSGTMFKILQSPFEGNVRGDEVLCCQK